MDAKSAEKEKSEGQEPPATLEKENPLDDSESAEQKQSPEEAETVTPDEWHLFNSIRSRMEFYFGDANLSKDRFLQRCVYMDPYLAPEVLLSFNKIMTLTEDVQQIAKPLSNSQLLELDESGLMVKRKTKQRDVNDKTLYVEALPANASHDWLKEVFSRYGPVAYVSLPHYPGTKKIKEFAFIEFQKAGSVDKAVKAFGQVHGVLSVEPDPGELASVRSFQPKEEQAEPEDPPKRSLKKEILDKGGHEAKRVKEEDVPPSESSTAEETERESEQDGKPEAADAKKRRRKRKKVIVDKPNIEPTALELKVLPRSSWSSLHKRLHLQARSMQWRENHPPQTNPEAVKEVDIAEADTESEQEPDSDGEYGMRVGRRNAIRMTWAERWAENKSKFGDGHHKIPGPDID